MNVRTLIDSIVRQTVVLIAQLATSGGLRAPLSQIAEQVFLELARELERQGVSRKVSADMFGMALRTYQRRTQRIAQSRTDRGRSLWEAVFEFVRQGGVVTREQVMHRFRHDDEPSLKGVLRDLTESGLVFATGRSDAMVYRITTDDELAALQQATRDWGLDALLWSFVFREGPISRERLVELSKAPSERVEQVMAELLAAGRVERVDSAGEHRYRSRELVLGFADPAGWEAAVLDHYTALVRTIGHKLAFDQRADAGDQVGGSTYHFALWHGHPMQDEVLGELGRFRKRQSELRDRIDRYNDAHPERTPDVTVTAYYGQHMQEDDDGTLR